MSRNPLWRSWSACTTRLARPARAAATGVAVSLTAVLSAWTPGAAAPVALAANRGPDAGALSPAMAVGALFTDQKGKLTHFCTASVVASPAGDLLLTAAHCLEGRSLTPAGSVVFAPGYHGRRFPLGTFEVRKAFTDRRWQRSHSPDDDFAFLIAGKPGQQLQKETGAESLETSARLPQRVRVIGYPDASSRPITCASPARAFTAHGLHQMVFDCPGYTDGTSGGPFLVDVRAATGDGKVIGDIGGYEQGGNTPSVSYSAQFRANIAALYRTARS